MVVVEVVMEVVGEEVVEERMEALYVFVTFLVWLLPVSLLDHAGKGPVDCIKPVLCNQPAIL